MKGEKLVQNRLADCWLVRLWYIHFRCTLLQSKCEAIMETMKMARIPLSAQIEKLIQEGMELEHPKSVSAEKHYNISSLLTFMFSFKKNFLRLVNKSCFYMMYKYLNSFLFTFTCAFVDFIEPQRYKNNTKW